MYYVYAIKSTSRVYIYVGLTDNVKRRIEQHNNGYEHTTKPYAPFFHFYTSSSFATRPLARIYEKYLKSGIGKEYLKSLLANI